MKRIKNTYLALLAILLSPMVAHADIIFDNFTLAATTFDTVADFSFSAIFRSDTNQTVSQIGALLNLSVDANLAFHIFSLGATSGPPVADQAPAFTTNQFFSADFSMVYRESDTFSFNLLAGQWYAVAVGADVGVIFSTDNETSVNPGATFTSLANQNYNVRNAYSNPNLVGSVTGCCNIHYQLHGTTTVPEPGTFMLLGIGLAGMGFTRRRQKV